MKTILLIDDDKDMLTLTERWLQRAGYEVTSASSGDEALSKLREMRPDLILLDYCMPGMDGPAVLSEIRRDDNVKDVPVLYRTGMDDAAGSDGGPQADGIVPKSEGKGGLMEALAKYL